MCTQENAFLSHMHKNQNTLPRNVVECSSLEMLFKTWLDKALGNLLCAILFMSA